MAEAIPGTEEWNGSRRSFLGHGSTSRTAAIRTVSSATATTPSKACANFPKTFANLGYLYTVNPDPEPSNVHLGERRQRHRVRSRTSTPTPVPLAERARSGSWRRVSSSTQPQCTPASYVSLQVLKPARETYSSGSVAFADGDGNLIPGLEGRQLDTTGTAGLAGLELNTPTGLPQFLITLNGAGKVGSVEIKLTWTADYNATCIGPNTTVTAPAPPPPPPPATTAVLAAKTTTPAKGTASIASIRGCIARTSYLASVHGTSISAVTFKVDGHTVKVLHKPTGKNTYAARDRRAFGLDPPRHDPRRVQRVEQNGSEDAPPDSGALRGPPRAATLHRLRTADTGRATACGGPSPAPRSAGARAGDDSHTNNEAARRERVRHRPCQCQAQPASRMRQPLKPAAVLPKGRPPPPCSR